MKSISILFFGSTSDSVIVLEKLFTLHSSLFTLQVAAVVTQPPRPTGRDHIVTPTPVEVWGKSRNIPILSFESDPLKPWLYKDEKLVIDTLQSIRPDLLISSSYGQKIPWETIQKAPRGGINVHPSILPRWRGGDPVPWAILTGDHQIGVTVVTLSEKFDEGKILAQKKIPLSSHDTSDPLRTKLFVLGSELLVRLLPDHIRGAIKGTSQQSKNEPQAKRLSRDLGREPWELLEYAINDGKDADRIERKFRALYPWPGVWTKINLQINKSTNDKSENRRLKILKLHVDNDKLVLDQVQLEGKKPVSWELFKKSYLDTAIKSN